MRLLKITILAIFIVFSAACFYLSAKKNSLPTHHAQTFQKANSKTIKGDFERENRFEEAGVKAEMSKQGDDFFIAFDNQETYKIEAVVGTEKLEEYIVRKDGKLFRVVDAGGTGGFSVDATTWACQFQLDRRRAIWRTPDS